MKRPPNSGSGIGKHLSGNRCSGPGNVQPPCVAPIDEVDVAGVSIDTARISALGAVGRIVDAMCQIKVAR
jgi:hypothetical protein